VPIKIFTLGMFYFLTTPCHKGINLACLSLKRKEKKVRHCL